MDSGNKIIKQILNCLELNASNSSRKQPQSSIKGSSSETTKQKKTFVLKKKQQDLRSKILRIHPSLSSTHVYKLFGILGINEHAISVPDFEESIFVNQFYGRAIQRVQIYRNAILIDLSPPDKSSFQYSHEQIAQRFKSHGNMNFYHLALQIEEVSQLFHKFINAGQNNQNGKNDSITKYLDSLGESLFFVKFGLNKVALSKKLLQYLDYDLEEFVIEAVKYRTIFLEIFSSNCYLSFIKHTINIMKHLLAFLQKSITLEEFSSLTTCNLVDYIYSKHHARTYCDFTVFLPTPNTFCVKITKIKYKSNQLQWKQFDKSEKKEHINTLKKEFREKEYSIIDQLKELPTGKMSSYKFTNINNTQSIKTENG